MPFEITGRVMRTFTRAQVDEARAAWDVGDFSDEWKPFRHLAVMGGNIWPPDGTKWDSWDDDNPSQRAMLIRAIRETPELLRRCMVGAKDWHVVLDRLMKARDDWRAELDAKARDEARRMAEDAVPHREAVTSLAAILTRIEDAR